jgi:hypothetical protein
MGQKVIIENKKAGHGLIGLPAINVRVGTAGKSRVKAFSLYAGHNELPVEVWEVVRTLARIQNLIKKGVLIEVNLDGAPKAPTADEKNRILTLDEFFAGIEAGENGVRPEHGGHFLVTLDEKVKPNQLPTGGIRSFRIKASSEDAIIVAYGEYVIKMGGKPTPKIKVKTLESMNLEEATEIIKDTYNPKNLKNWEKTLKGADLRVLVLNQIESIKKYEGPKSEI